jgi:Domain of unknown function (DUF4157)/OmpA family
MSSVAFAEKSSSAPALKAGAGAKIVSGGLRIGEANDSFEREADRIAFQVMNGETTKKDWSFSHVPINPSLQRKCSCGEPASEGECDECKQDQGKTVQRKPSGPGGPNFAPAIVNEVLNSTGQPLDKTSRNFFEHRFGRDFSRVRIHADSKAADSARAVNALAYTVGEDIALASNQYLPSTNRGRYLLAHELAHVVQQTGRAGFGIAPRLQRVAADSSAIPPGMTCVTDPSPGGNADMSLTGVKLTTLSPAQKKQIADFRKSWLAAGSKDFIAVEGYASPDSGHDTAAQQKANWRYSCTRAEMVQAEFIKLGVPRSRVITFAHGETDQFSKTNDPDQNRRVNISRVQVAAPGTLGGSGQSVQAPSGLDVKGTSDGTNTQIQVNPTGKKDITGTQPTPQPQPQPQPKPATADAQEATERMFSVTLEFDLKNDWKSRSAPGAANAPKSPFLCDHGIYQLGVKWNNGITLKKDRLELLNEPELDINVADPLCEQNPSITAQVNLLKFTIFKKLLEADLVGVLGLPDGWATGLSNRPFGAGSQIKLQATPFARLSSDFSGLKIGLFGGLGFEQGVEVPKAGEEPRSRVWTFGGFIGLDYDVGPVKKKEKKDE